MTAVLAPYGLLPVKKVGSNPDVSGRRTVAIASGYTTSIFYGDVVRIAGGVIVKEAGTAAVTATGVLGVFLGCSFTDPIYGKTFRQYWPASTVAADAVAYVSEDPMELYNVALVSSGTTISGSAATALLGKNAALVQNAGSTVTGRSAVAINGVATTATLPIRIVDIVPGTQDASNNYTAALVMFNFGMHSYQVAAGAA